MRSKKYFCIAILWTSQEKTTDYCTFLKNKCLSLQDKQLKYLWPMIKLTQKNSLKNVYLSL